MFCNLYALFSLRVEEHVGTYHLLADNQSRFVGFAMQHSVSVNDAQLSPELAALTFGTHQLDYHGEHLLFIYRGVDGGCEREVNTHVGLRPLKLEFLWLETVPHSVRYSAGVGIGELCARNTSQAGKQGEKN